MSPKRDVLCGNERIKKKITNNCVEPAKISWFLFAIDLTTKEEEENVEIYKEKKKKKKLKSRATHNHKSTKFHENKNKKNT